LGAALDLPNKSNDFACALTDAPGQLRAQTAAGALSAKVAAGAIPMQRASATRADPIKGTRPIYFPE
jgi:hypothetical protein